MAARVRRGGHDIPEADIRRRYTSSQINLIRLMPRLTVLAVFDNSAQADPAVGARRADPGAARAFPVARMHINKTHEKKARLVPRFFSLSAAY